MKWRLCIAIAEPQQSYPAAKKQKQTQKQTQNDVSGVMNDQEGRSHFFTSAKGEQPRPGPKLSQFPGHFKKRIYMIITNIKSPFIITNKSTYKFNSN